MKKETEIGYVHLATWKDGNRLCRDSEICSTEELLPAGEYTLEITYPLNRPYTEECVWDRPLTREDIVKWVTDRYRFIYKVEDETSENLPALIPGMSNRNVTNGKYGIWGHYIDDLYFHTIWVDENNVITLGIDS
jgi:hypothetical protein